MASGFSFSDPVRRYIEEAAMTLSQYSSPFLAAPYTERRDFPDALLVSNVIPYEIDLPPNDEGDFRTWGVEGGNAIQRLSNARREGTIYSFPVQVFLTDDEINLRKIRGGPSLIQRATKVLGTLCKRFRIYSYFDSLQLSIDENESSDYDSAIGHNDDGSTPGDGTEDLTYTKVQEAMSFFNGDYRESTMGWHMHTDLQRWAEGEADRTGDVGKIKWFERGAKNASFPKGQVMMDGLPVVFSPWEDTVVQKDFSTYTRSGLRYLTDPDQAYNVNTNPYIYRTYLMTDMVMKEYIGWSPSQKMMDTAPVPAGTVGYPANGQSSGVTWFLSMIHGNILELPRDMWDRIGIFQILHQITTGDSQE